MRELSPRSTLEHQRNGLSTEHRAFLPCTLRDKHGGTRARMRKRWYMQV